MSIICLLLALLQPPAAPAAPAAKPPEPLKRHPGPNEAQALALADIRTVPLVERPYTHYIWNDSRDPLWHKTVSLYLNMVSRATDIVRPEPVGDGSLLVRINLRWYAPQNADLKEWVAIFEELQFDPRFSRLYTRGTLASATQDFKGRGFVIGTQSTFIDTPPYKHNGEMVHGKWEQRRVSGVTDFVLRDLKDVELIRQPSTDLQTYLALVELTGSQAPVVSDSYFLVRALSQIQETGVWNTIYGGLYYRLAGIRKSQAKGVTDEDLFFEEHLGIGNEKKRGVAAFYEALRSDQRAAIFTSKVRAEAPRGASFVRAPGGARLDRGTGLVSITDDFKNQNSDVDNHPVLNLLKRNVDARECIAEKPNGLHLYALFNGKGELQDEVPPDVANDSTIPRPYNQRLQPAVSCISCHEGQGDDGWKPFPNDVLTLTKKQPKLRILGDTSRLNDSNSDTVDRLKGLYGGLPEPALARGRDDYAKAVLWATGGWPASKRGQADAVQLAAEALMRRYDRYWHAPVTASSALSELQIEVDSKIAIETLDRLLPPDRRSLVNVFGFGPTLPEDPRTAALKCGLTLNRVDFDLSRSFMEDRIRQTEALLKKGKK